MCVHTHTHTQEYYSSMKKNETMPFAVIWMDIEIVIQNEVSQTEEKYHDIDYTKNLKRHDTKELTYKTEKDSQT